VASSFRSGSSSGNRSLHLSFVSSFEAGLRNRQIKKLHSGVSNDD
jgi:hypothetical protein